jgi:hypothetical protein
VSTSFFDGFSIACLVVAGVSAAGAVVALLLLPAHPAAGLAMGDGSLGDPADAIPVELPVSAIAWEE